MYCNTSHTLMTCIVLCGVLKLPGMYCNTSHTLMTCIVLCGVLKLPGMYCNTSHTLMTCIVYIGWGVWGGDGTKPTKKPQVKPQKLVKPRSDRDVGHVIIGDHSNVKINKHLVSHQLS